MANVDYGTLKKGGFMRQKQKNNFSLRLAVVGGTLTAENLKKIAEVAEKGTVGKSVEVFGDCCSRISSFCSLWDFVFSSNAFKRKSSVYLVPRFLPVIYFFLPG